MKKFILLVVTVLVCQNLFAQNTIIHGGLDGNTKRSVTVKKKNAESSKGRQESDVQDIDPWLVNFSIGHLFRGMAVIGVEHCLQNKLGFEANVGFCYFRGRYYASEELKLSQVYNNEYDLSNKNNYYAGITAKYYTKYYESPSANNDIRYYVGAQIRTYQQNLKLGSYYTAANNRTSSPINNLGVYGQIGMVTNSVSLANAEIYLGFGLLNTNYEKYARSPITANYESDSKGTYGKFSTIFGLKYGITVKRHKKN